MGPVKPLILIYSLMLSQTFDQYVNRTIQKQLLEFTSS